MNLYYYPEHQGCKIVAVLDQAGAYAFNTILFVQKDGEVRYACDSGCSCPTPFDGVTWESATPVRNSGDVERAVMRWWNRDPDRWDGGGVTLAQCRDLIRKVTAGINA